MKPKSPSPVEFFCDECKAAVGAPCMATGYAIPKGTVCKSFHAKRRRTAKEALVSRASLATQTFCTTFCNQAHRLSDGRPVGHECYILNPESLAAEREGRFEDIAHMIQQPRQISPGVKAP